MLTAIMLILLALGFGKGDGSGGRIFIGLCAAIPAWFIYQGFMHNLTAYPVEQKRWENTFRCGRCENVFVPAALARELAPKPRRALAAA